MNDIAPNKTNTLTPEQQILLAEYEEIGKSWRHDDEIAWRILRIFIPTSLAGFYVAISTENNISVVFVGVLASLIIWVAFGFYARKMYHMLVRFGRALEIEEILSMDHHNAINRRSKSDSPQRPRIPRVRRLLLLVTWTITILWALIVILRLTDVM
ncbi:hypothetical protein KKG05_10445 [bacterium]|nr:hypothetical protein [bacterium]